MATLTDIPFSLLDLASVPSGSNISATLQRMLRYAQHADQLGVNRFWLAEHHNMDGIASSATAVLIGQVAAHTERIRVGSGGIMLPNHAPLIVAEQFGTLDCLFPGRIDLGLGRAPGTDPITSRALRRDDMRAERFPEEVAELQALLGPANAEKRVRAYPGADSQVDIWLLGSSLFSAQLAAQRGLPYAFAGHFAPKLAREALALYQQNFQPSPGMKEPYAILCLPLILADSDDEAQYLSTSSQQRVLSLLKGQPLYLPPPVESMTAICSPMEQLQIDAFLGLAVTGGPATVQSKLARLIDSLPVQELMFTNDIYDEQQRLHALSLLQQLKS
ncbi:LLM class flavin-dependent oxidoreductase [Bacterioplanoides pacificum]|uniref:LLM class flavin-dependent oxidoreductase n=1 Tax=Bacterioplanoides pacificum TaxID=1171596 RepID=A0ABV7VVC0_9GAMM